MLFHVTDEGLVHRILREGLIGNPVVYLATAYQFALDIRYCQVTAGEKFGACQVFAVTGEYELLIDPHVRATPIGYAAYMVYQDIPPHHLHLVYA